MKRYILTIPFLIFLFVFTACTEKKERSSRSSGKTQGEKFIGDSLNKTNTGNKPSTLTVDVNFSHTPSFPGGFKAMCAFLKANTKMPDAARKMKIEGKVIVDAKVDAQGNITRCTIFSSDNDIFNDEALRVVKSMPRLTPAHNGGKATASEMKVAVPFRLQ